MSFAQVTTFIAVAESGSVSAAAKRLRISQPPLTRRLQELEHDLGTPLFLRGPRGMALSPAGERLLPHARAVLDAVAAARAAVDAASAESRSRSDRSAIGEAIGTDRT